MTRAFANAGLRQSSNDNAIFFDVFSLFMLWWPQRWTTLIAVIILIVLILGALGRIRSGSATARGIIIGIMSFFVSILAAAAGALAVGSSPCGLLPLSGQRSRGRRSPAWLIGITCAVVVAAIAVTRAEFEGCSSATRSAGPPSGSHWRKGCPELVTLQSFRQLRLH
ncbi:MAG: hypothetical protein Udaeo2_11620 [Candidatus Udaeobacter sp.]|nr:MAG: hypothetical protein Udaeo2_11620 [Candidatus Udaeobacter sp.]